MMAQSVMQWQKSSYCMNGACDEVAFGGDLVALRDSKNPDLGAIQVTRAQWVDFVRGVQAHEFDRF